MPTLSHADLAPYITLLLLRAPTAASQKASVSSVLDDIKSLVSSLNDDDVSRKVHTVGAPTTQDGLTLGFLHLVEARRPSWLVADAPIALTDRVHAVVLVAQAKDLVAVCASDSWYHDRISRAAWAGDGEFPHLQELAPIAPGVLNAAFVEGHARTLWLVGVHRPTAVKPDAKVLSGSNLVNALNPLGDQSYMFSAVRCNVSTQDLARATIGVTPRRSRVWTGASVGHEEFRSQVAGILRHLHKVDRAGTYVDSPLPYLASPVFSAGTIATAYDCAVLAPELLADDPQFDQRERALAEKYAYRTRFKVTPTVGPNFRVAMNVDGLDIGTFEVTVEIAPSGRVTHEVAVASVATDSSVNKTREAARALARREWLSVYYESGHAIARGSCYLPQYRDQSFESWDWRPFKGYSVHQEKPINGKSVAFEEIGKQTSLFCYSHKRWSIAAPSATGTGGKRQAWLACDDGALETADFVRFECGGSARPRLTLIHVKGSHSASPARELSVTAYEIVVGQAVKNIRALDTSKLLQRLERGGDNHSKRFCWLDSQAQADRRGMIAAIQAANEQFEKEVIIVQPSARRSEYAKAILPKRSGGALPAGAYYRRAQLDTLLIAAQAACYEVGAKLIVVADDS